MSWGRVPTTLTILPSEGEPGPLHPRVAGRESRPGGRHPDAPIAGAGGEGEPRERVPAVDEDREVGEPGRVEVQPAGVAGLGDDGPDIGGGAPGGRLGAAGPALAGGPQGGAGGVPGAGG